VESVAVCWVLVAIAVLVAEEDIVVVGIVEDKALDVTTSANPAVALQLASIFRSILLLCNCKLGSSGQME
jgi:uncharacterized membrane protein YraQ (UPF0718 family)